VGPDEFDLAPDYISMDAPLARSLLGKSLDDELTVTVGERTTTYTIVAVDYAAS
jgi:transcription elongation factor GreB